jgi:hypothetical protein
MMADRTGRGKRYDPAEWTAYGQRGPGRPKVGGEAVNVSLPPAHVAGLDAIAAARSVKRSDILREAVAFYLRHHRATQATEPDRPPV